MQLHPNPHQKVWARRLTALAGFCASVGVRAELTPDDLLAKKASLIEQQERLVARSQQVIDTADRESRELTSDEKQAIRRRTAEVERLQDQLDSIETLLTEPRSRITPYDSGDPLGLTPQQSVSPITARRSVAAADRVAPLVDLRAPVGQHTYARLFGAAPARAADGDPGFARFALAVAARDTQFLLERPAAGATTGIGTDGGFSVPPRTSGELFDRMVEKSQFLRYCRVVPLTGKTTTYPVLNDSDRSKGPGKFTAQKLGEAGAATPQTPALREMTLTAHKRIVYWPVSTELLQDSLPGTDRALVDAAAGTLAMEVDREIVGGSGVSAMLGFGASAARVVVAKDGGQAANTVSYSNLTGMLARLLGTSWGSAIWLVSQTTLPQLFSVYNPVLNSSNVVGGLPAPLTQAPDGSYRLFGLPLVISDFMPALSSEGDISLVDLSRYLVGMREDLRIEVSNEHLFSSDQVAFRVIQRRDGMPIDAEPITPAVGSTALSPFIQLGAR